MARHHSQLYRQIRDQDPHDYHRVIRRYEEWEADIGRLDVQENFELTTYYVDALYATGAYRQHQLMVDLVIQNCIVHSIDEVEGISTNVYHYMLFRKAAAAYRLHDFATAIHVGRELIRMDPDRKLYGRFLRLALFRRQTRTLQFGRAAFVAGILIAAGLVLVNILWIRTFYPDAMPRMSLAIAVAILAAFAVLGGAYAVAYLRAHREAYGFRHRQANKAQRKRIN